MTRVMGVIRTLLRAGDADWIVRRTMAVLTLIACFALVVLASAFSMWGSMDLSLASTIVTSSYTLAGVVVTGYVVVATVDQRAKPITEARAESIRAATPAPKPKAK